MFQRDQRRYKSSFINGNGAYDQLVMNAPRKLTEDVSNKFPYF